MIIILIKVFRLYNISLHILLIHLQIILKLHALQDAQNAKLETQTVGVCLLILMGSVDISAQNQDIVGMEKLTKLVLTVMIVELTQVRIY